MKLIVGLGNIGKDYLGTRHNVGFEVVDKLAINLSEEGWQQKKKFEAFVLEMTWNKQKIVFAKPSTMMNESGRAVAKLVEFYRVEAPDIWVIHDDLDLALGRIQIKIGGGSGGHHGLQSIISCLDNTNFVRWRCGIGKIADKKVMTPQEGSGFVVGRFNRQEKKIAGEMIGRCAESIEFAMQNDLNGAMNQYN